MNIKRLIPAILVGFLGVFGADFLIHGIWLAARYKEISTTGQSPNT